MAFLNERGLKRSLAGLWDTTKAYIDGRPYGDQNAFLVKAPVGTIVIWSGTTSDIPTGWQLCDGTNSTPDLRDKFVLGAGENHPVGETGGAEKVTLTTEQMPAHGHGVYYATNRLQSGSNRAQPIAAIDSEGSANWITPSGGSQPHPNMPPYYTLCYIMKMAADEGDGIPIVSISYEAYQALSEAEKDRDDVIWLVEDAPEQPSVTVSIEEYDTADGWHVRKWSNGYVEMSLNYESTTAGMSLNNIGNLYFLMDVLPKHDYPVPLIERYSEIGTGLVDSTAVFFQYGFPPNRESATLQYGFARPINTLPGVDQFKITIHVTGRWK